MAIRCPNSRNGRRCDSEYIIQLGKDKYICNECKMPVYIWPSTAVTR